MPSKPKIDLKKFRSQIALLKKKGLISNVDARSAQPYYIRQGKRLDEYVKKYDDVISGKMEPVFLTPQKTKQYKASGYETKKIGKKTVTLIPKSATEKVSKTKDGDVKIEHPKGMVRIKKMVPYENIPQWLTAMSRNYKRIDSELPPHHKFFYKFFGHNSYSTFADIRLMIDAFRNGSASGLNLMDKARQSTHKQQNELYQNLEILFWNNRTPYPEPAAKRSPTTKAARKRYRRRVKDTAVGERMREANRKAQQKYRDELKGKDLKEYKREAKKRAKKSRNRGKKGTKKK